MSLKIEAAAFRCLESVLATSNPLTNVHGFFVETERLGELTAGEAAEAEQRATQLLTRIPLPDTRHHRAAVRHGAVYWGCD